ncbi:DUF732 domain-containing protein [Mycobacterium malmoense]|uniref:DUF732 domain-containing protein n=1 Tax=Mycobacterium malmoense TaxID=1780 RepID=UPI0008F83116|nr:DUF732 domain-containing protein [Mycobacterium malmoense]OIN79105.1 hypothetical protein BMG05_19880 [Mycobacterium malmoense]
MATTAGKGVARRHPDPDEDQQPATAAGVCDDVTATVSAPATEAAQQLAWSREEPVTEVLARPWRSVWALATVGVLAAVVVGVVIAAVGIGGHAQRTAAPVTVPVAALAPTPTTKPPADDDEYVAMAISLRALNSHSLSEGGFGTGSGGSQERANQIALSECRSKPGYDDCLLVNTGMYHGCVSIAIDNAAKSRWASGAGADPAAAQVDALGRLKSPGAIAAVQCSNPPGILTESPPPAPPVAEIPRAVPPPAAEPAPAAAAPDPDQVFRRLVLQIPGMHVTSWPITEAGGHRVCGYLRAGHSRDDATTQVLTNDPTFTPWQASAMVNASVTAYCPQFDG